MVVELPSSPVLLSNPPVGTGEVGVDNCLLVSFVTGVLVVDNCFLDSVVTEGRDTDCNLCVIFATENT